MPRRNARWTAEDRKIGLDDAATLLAIELPRSAYSTDYYSLLGVPPDASIAELRAAYIDRLNTTEPAGHSALVEAYKVVALDDDSRRKYDVIRAHYWRRTRDQVFGASAEPLGTVSRERFTQAFDALVAAIPGDFVARVSHGIHKTGRLEDAVAELDGSPGFAPAQFGDVQVDLENRDLRRLLLVPAVAEACARHVREFLGPDSRAAAPSRDLADRYGENLREIWGVERPPPAPEPPVEPMPERPRRNPWGTRRNRPGQRRGGRMGRGPDDGGDPKRPRGPQGPGLG